MLDIVVVLLLGCGWLWQWAKKNGLLSPFLGSRLDDGGGSGHAQIDADLTNNEVPYPSRVPSSLGILYTRQSSSAAGGKGSSSSQLQLQHELHRLAAFLLHCSRAGVRKVVVHGASGNDGDLARALQAVLDDYAQDSIRIESHAGLLLLDQSSEKAEKTDVDVVTTTCVRILPAARSGRATMVEAAKQLCRRSASSSPVTTSAVAAALAGAMLDDLQAVVMVGGAPTLAAFPPWPLRIAELLPVADLPRAKADFVRCLGAFGARDIRAGK